MTIPPELFLTYSLRASPHGDAICQILASAMNSADAGVAVRNHVRLCGNKLIVDQKEYMYDHFERVFVIGAGKAVVPMASELCEILGNRITTGLVITKYGYLGSVDKLRRYHISVLEAAHPIPDQSNLDASLSLSGLLHNLQSTDLIICLVSGGGSALCLKPSLGISLTDLQVLTHLLLACGANIGEINTIRKHMDEFKGGGLARLLYPTEVASLIISDVVGDDLGTIASGLTVADPTTYQDAWSIFEKYQITGRIPPSIYSHIQDGIGGKIPETLKPGNPAFRHVDNFVVASNTQTVDAAERAAKARGFTTKLLTTQLQGEAHQAGHSLVENAKSLLASPGGLTRPACLIAGGETTVTLHGNGLGGRNQELALGAVKKLSGDLPFIVVSLATDGGDGPTDAAGAVATNQTYQRGIAMQLDPDEYLASNDAYHYFEHLGDLIKTGPTLTNVNDLVLIFAL